jgi:DNA-binding transcriptional LysR family regulator
MNDINIMQLKQRLKPSHLNLIQRVAENGQLGIAAQTLGMAQPAASRILAEIEAHIGITLFERHPKGMTPTAAGSVFVKHSRTILTAMENLEYEVTHLKTGQLGEVRIGAVTGPTVGCVVPAVQKVKASSVDLRITIEVGPSTHLIRGLVEGEFDFVIARLPPEYDSRDFKIIPARSEIVSLLARKNHPLSGAKQLQLADLKDYEWVIQEHRSPIRQALENAFHSSNVKVPSNITNTSSALVMLTYLENTDAITAQSQEVALMLTRPYLGANLKVLDTSEDIRVSPFFIIQNRNQQLSPAASLLMNEVITRIQLKP